MMNLLLLCFEFFKTGLFAVGGGMAAIPYLARMAETHPEWFSLEMLADMIAVSESTPGPIGINMATYAGFVVAGVPGAVLASLSMVLPCLIIMLCIAGALNRYNSNPYVQWAFGGLRPAVTGLIAAAGFTVLQMAVLPEGSFDWRCALLFLLVLAATQIKKLKKLHPIAYIAAAAVAGILFGL